MRFTTKKLVSALVAAVMSLSAIAVTVSAAGIELEEDSMVPEGYTYVSDFGDYVWGEKDGEKYLFEPFGDPVEGVIFVDGAPYGFYMSGQQIINDWAWDNKECYYFGSNGRAYTDGIYKIDGSYYMFDEFGVQLFGLQKFKGDYYYFRKDTGERVSGFVHVGDDTYCFAKDTGKLYSGFVKKNGHIFYFLKNGKMAKDVTLSINGRVCEFDKNGYLKQ